MKLNLRFPSREIYTCLRKVDVSDYLPIVEHPIMLSLEEKSQLSFVYKVFPGGKHSRYEHSLFVYHFTDEVNKHLYEKGCIDEEQMNDTKIASLLHDVGHGPFSHYVERILGFFINPKEPLTHEKMGMELLKSKEVDREGRTIRECIEECGGNFERIVKIVGKEAKEASIISHHTLGTDKCAYTLVDAHHTGYLIDKPYFLDLFKHVIYFDGEMGILALRDIISQTQRLQTLIQEMYTNVYYNEKVVRFGRLMEKALEREIRIEKLDPREVWRMNEGALIYRLENSKDRDVRELIKRYRRNELYETALQFRIESYAHEKNSIPIDKNFARKLTKKFMNRINLTSLEERISEVTKIPWVDILVTLSADPERIVPEDVNLYSVEDNSVKKIGTLFNSYPLHHSSLLEKSEDFFALRVAVTPKMRDKILSKRESIKETVTEMV